MYVYSINVCNIIVFSDFRDNIYVLSGIVEMWIIKIN